MAITIDGDGTVAGATSITGLTATGLPGVITNTTSDPVKTSNKAAGHIWVNRTSGEAYVCIDATTNNNEWYNIASGEGNVNIFDISGGTTLTYSHGGTNYNLRKFTSTATFTALSDGSVDMLLVAGGGGGGSNGNGGGGGAGGVLWRTAQALTSGTTYTATVGAGGAKDTNGGDSTVTGSGFSTLTATGGGGGGSNDAGNAGGSGGGGGGLNQAGGAGTSGQGNTGGAGQSSGSDYDHHGGGGGGAGAAGAAGNSSSNNAGNGGAGGTTLTNQSSAVTDATTLLHSLKVH